MAWNEFDTGFVAGMTVARRLSPALVARIVEALDDAEGTRQARATLAALLADRPGGIVDGAIDGLLAAIVEREPADEGHEGTGGDPV